MKIGLNLLLLHAICSWAPIAQPPLDLILEKIMIIELFSTQQNTQHDFDAQEPSNLVL
jgi:hypothetical protein